jgi:hypothetical protein
MSSLKRHPSIGTRNESSLHRALKFRYAGPGGETEITAGEYIADVKRDDGEYIEIQIGSFGPLKDKIKALAGGDACGGAAKVRIVHPVAVKKIIEVYEPPSKGKPGALASRRKSPKKGTQWDLFDALVYAPRLPLVPGLTIEIALIDITEKRVKDGKGSRHRNGVSLQDREMTAWHESVILAEPADYLRFIPFKKGEPFTSALLSQRADINKWVARKTLYVLTNMELLEKIGKKGNFSVYAVK